MKSTIKFFLAAIATGLVMTSCSDELFSEENGNYSQSEGTRTIAVSFGPQTRTALENDGLSPKFTGIDEWVMVSNENESEKCQIIVENDVAFFKTNLKGTLKAVYPATAADLGKENIIRGITIPTTQSGKFADANICMAENINNSATFVNKTAILKFYVDESINVKEIDITGDKITGTPGATIHVLDENKRSLHEVTDGPDKRICYVAINSGVDSKTLTFTSHTETQEKVVRKSPVDVTLEAGKMYNAFIPYYIEVNGVKWGYCNVGAFLPEEPGEFFACGETIGHKLNDAGTGFADGHNFNWANCPFNGANAEYDATYYNTTLAIAYPNDCLSLQFDAANANWGDGWRMPNYDDRSKLSSVKPTFSDGLLTISNSPLVFPASGWGDGTSYKDKNTQGYYLISKKNSTNPHLCLMFNFSSSSVGFSFGKQRNLGLSVRPVYDATAILKEPVLLPGEFSVNGDGKKVRFTGGNLYWKADNWYVEKNQWDSHTTGSNGVGMFYFSTDAAIARTQPYSDSNVLAADKLFCDEERSLTIEGEEGHYCLSNNEWQHLVTGRTAQTNLCARARVNGHNGLLIFPDGYSQGTTVTGTGIGDVNVNNGEFPTENMPSDTWSVMESNGVLFLATLGNIRDTGSFNLGSDDTAFFWTSTCNNNSHPEWASSVLVNKVRATTGLLMYDNRNIGRSIRLVKNIPQAAR